MTELDEENMSIVHLAITHAQEDICSVLYEIFAAVCWIFHANLVISIIVTICAVFQRFYSIRLYAEYSMRLKEEKRRNENS